MAYFNDPEYDTVWATCGSRESLRSINLKKWNDLCESQLETYSEQNIPHEKLTIWNRFRIESVPFFLAPKGVTRGRGLAGTLSRTLNWRREETALPFYFLFLKIGCLLRLLGGTSWVENIPVISLRGSREPAITHKVVVPVIDSSGRRKWTRGAIQRHAIDSRFSFPISGVLILFPLKYWYEVLDSTSYLSHDLIGWC